MSEFDYEMSNEGYKCPYCGYEVTCDDWGYDYNGEEVECEECGKKYYATADHSVSFNSTPDCELNNEEHDLVNVDGIDKAKFCSKCNKCVLIKD